LCEYLIATTGVQRSALLRQLILLDWDYRHRSSDQPRLADYRTRFPDDLTLIEEIGREIAEAPPSTWTTGDPGNSACALHSQHQDSDWPDGPSNLDSSADRYQLVQTLGQGGIGMVFRCRDQLLGRELAVKVLREDQQNRPEVRRRFVEEARVASQLQHPAIVPVYEFGWFADRQPYITMKLVEGHTLATLLRKRSNPADDLTRLLGVFEQVCQAMAYAHS